MKHIEDLFPNLVLDGFRITSKLGRLEDIEHTLRGLEGEIYGTATVFLKRPIATIE